PLNISIVMRGESGQKSLSIEVERRICCHFSMEDWLFKNYLRISADNKKKVWSTSKKIRYIKHNISFF
ncbi:MAG: hypothetical protein VXA09_07990, partial [Burkholderiaceae bacterium]